MDSMKDLLAGFMNPLPMSLTILFVGVGFLWFSSNARTGKWLVTIGLLFLVLVGEGSLSSALIEPLEARYPAIDPARYSQESSAPVKYVVVLSAGHVTDTTVSLTSQITRVSLIRLIEGIRLHHALPGSKLVLSGDSAFDTVSEAAMMANLAAELGVNRADMIVEPTARNTEEQAQRIQSIVGQDRFVLVTSAVHMSRAVALLEKLALHPIPAPTGYYLRQSNKEGFSLSRHFPSGESIRVAERALHEYLGMTWSKLRGRI